MATEVSSIVIGIAGDGSFEEGCKRLMGEQRGTAMAPYLGVFAAMVAIPDAASGLLKFFSKDEMISVAATSNYYRNMDHYDAASKDQLEYYSQMMESILKSNNVTDAEALVITKTDEIFGVNALADAELKANEKLKKLIAEYEYNKRNVPVSGQDNLLGQDDLFQTNELLTGLTPAQQNKLNFILNGDEGQEILDLITDVSSADDIAKASKRLEALKDVLKSNVCF